ncbi:MULTISPECIES: hypothetical protein [Flavobacterium]|uniref:Uncharacterized protein n=1 Tax=Flavobacterium commune TaxID=1306519 RepID=A0A1D9PDK8_9FLAO|nr:MULTISPECIES: hypothetical protein [Flavobacterium]APA00613.1 hypothetical protein BIW12_14935 [Flavobacterium commune]
MDCFKLKYTFYTFFLFIILSCSSNNDDDIDDSPLELTITNFESSNNQVKIEWETIKPKGLIIEDLCIYRLDKNQETDFVSEKRIANLPSNETTFTDYDVPYKKEVSYKIRINYRDERTTPIQFLNLESEEKKFTRQIISFTNVPFQVQKDPIQTNIFHILDKKGNGYLYKYNSSKNNFEYTKTFDNGNLLNNRFQIINTNEIYIADTKGKVFRLNADNYNTIGTYSTLISDNLNAFAISGNRIYYQDEETWNFYNISTGGNNKVGLVTSMDYSEYLGNDIFLFLYSQIGYDAKLFGFSPNTCNNLDCWPTFYNFPRNPTKTYSVDPNIFSWNSSKSKFITSINGCVFNISDMNIEKSLSDITGKRYFQFAFDSNDTIYACVQAEKKIHVFNSKYELIDIIDTKLFPLFPMKTDNDLKVIGSYEPISYWSFGYGYYFNFNIECAIETIN